MCGVYDENREQKKNKLEKIFLLGICINAGAVCTYTAWYGGAGTGEPQSKSGVLSHGGLS